jgi:lipoyl(octanoyl) transferase
MKEMTNITWITSPAPVAYPEALAQMEARVNAIIRGEASEQIWLLEHPPLYTGGTSAKPSDIKAHAPFPHYQTGRGGQWTYHGPGQRIAYVMLNLASGNYPKQPDLRHYVWLLEEWLIQTLASFRVNGERRPGRVGIWVMTPQGECKIAALGVRLRKWVSFHGIALNVAPDLSHYQAIVPCGIREYGVTSLAALGVKASLAEVDTVLKQTFAEVFLRTS